MHLRPSAVQSVILLCLAALFAWLGQWQLERKHQKEDLLDQYAKAPEIEYAQEGQSNLSYAHVKLSGNYDPSWQLLLDNKVFQGRAGVHVLTLFRPAFGRPLLVNRGWLPLAPDRSKLPEINTPKDRIEISGVLVTPAEDGVRIGEPENLSGLRGPRLITYLEMGEVQSALGGNVSPQLLQLDANDNSGFQDRDWHPTVMTPAQHGAYALQWFALSLAIVTIWFTLSWRRGRRINSSENSDANGVQQKTS
jgi:cytochrome oxidase assembly protein ShyY1